MGESVPTAMSHPRRKCRYDFLRDYSASLLAPMLLRHLAQYRGHCFQMQVVAVCAADDATGRQARRTWPHTSTRTCARLSDSSTVVSRRRRTWGPTDATTGPGRWGGLSPEIRRASHDFSASTSQSVSTSRSCAASRLRCITSPTSPDRLTESRRVTPSSDVLSSCSVPGRPRRGASAAVSSTDTGRRGLGHRCPPWHRRGRRRTGCGTSKLPGIRAVRGGFVMVVGPRLFLPLSPLQSSPRFRSICH